MITISELYNYYSYLFYKALFNIMVPSVASNTGLSVYWKLLGRRS